MKTSKNPSLAAAGMLLALAASLAVAQTAPAKKPATKSAGKTLGGNAAGGGKLMTRDELRTCLKRLDDVNQGGKDIEALRPVLDRERDELKAAGEALKTERAALDAQLVSVREWEVKMRAHAADIEAFNKRSAAAADAPRNQQDKIAADLKSDRERLQKDREVLSVDEAKLVPVYQANAKAYNERAVARDTKVTDWNARNTAAVDAAVKQQEARALWLSECANRPYLDDDEKAIKAGK
jgi:Spy/CpxP family protein refolding chaperone